MWVLAVSPPVPLQGQIFIALLMLGLVHLLRKARKGRSVAMAIITTIGTVLLLEATFPNDWGGLYGLGLLSAFVGVVIGVIFFRPVEPQPGRVSNSSNMALCVITFLCGPVLGATAAAMLVLLTDVPPMDRAYIFQVLITICTVASSLASCIVAVAFQHSPAASISPDSVDSNPDPSKRVRESPPTRE
jgi:hypothetical protein